MGRLPNSLTRILQKLESESRRCMHARDRRQPIAVFGNQLENDLLTNALVKQLTMQMLHLLKM